MAIRKLTEVDGCTLSLVRAHRPRAVYTFRGVFRQSLASLQRSAGAICPLFRRLED